MNIALATHEWLVIALGRRAPGWCGCPSPSEESGYIAAAGLLGILITVLPRKALNPATWHMLPMYAPTGRFVL
jgi:hypothetical protein